MGDKVFFDVVNRLIEVIEPPVNGVQSLDLRRDFYSAAKDDWERNEFNERSHKFPFITSETAGSETTGGREEPIFFRLRNGVEGWRFYTYDSNHTLTIVGAVVPENPSNPILVPRVGRTVAIITDGSEVASLTEDRAASAIWGYKRA